MTTEILNIITTNLIATATPLAGRLAFAAVFGLLILWLIWIPAGRLQDPTQPSSGPSVTVVRIAAITIAGLQVLLYLFWG
jgi:hypothetical protein